MGAWIETYQNIHLRLITLSLPMWERGLKLVVSNIPKLGAWSLPMWERGLKLILLSFLALQVVSLPMWERGLKQ